MINKKIIIIDDDISLCKMLKMLLEEVCPTDYFSDIKEAAKYLKSHSKDVSLLLLDYNIGYDNGIDFYKEEILNKDNIKNIPAILISGFIVTQLKTDKELEELDQLFLKVIEKPFDFDELKNYIERALKTCK